MNIKITVTTLMSVAVQMAASHWLCKAFGNSCDGLTYTTYDFVANVDGSWKRDPLFLGEGLPFMVCILRCRNLGCTGLLYVEDGQCYGIKESNTDVMYKTGIFKKEKSLQVISQERRTFCDQAASFGPASYAVDGDHDTFYKTATDAEPWLTIDLGEKFNIKKLRIRTRQDTLFDKRFTIVGIYFGNVPNSDYNDFSAFQKAGTINGPPTDLEDWWIFTTFWSESFRFVALRREDPNVGSDVLEVSEIQIYS